MNSGGICSMAARLRFSKALRTDPEPEAVLRGMRILVTRPAGQSAALCRRISEAGGNAMPFPVIGIAPPESEAEARRVLAACTADDVVIFVSRNAAVCALKLMEELPALLSGRQTFAAGPGTRAELERYGISAAIGPGHGGEALLSLEALKPAAVSGRRVLIVRGAGGREQLREELTERGAQVRYAEVYRRKMPDVDAELVRKIWQDERPDVIVTTSNQSLDHLVALTGNVFQDSLFETPLVVVSARAERHARDLGFRAAVLIAAGPDDVSLLQAAAMTRSSPE
jgi:uroporphyrinogen-III synthase